MKKVILTPAIALCLLAISAPLRADSLCGLTLDDMSALNDRVVGTWNVESGVGRLTMAGNQIALPPGPPDVALIGEVADNRLDIYSPQVKGSYALNWVDPAQTWRITSPDDTGAEAMAVLDNIDLAQISGCADANDLPRLYATGSFTEEAGTVEFELFLFFLDTELMYGVTVGRLNGDQGTARRLLTFTR